MKIGIDARFWSQTGIGRYIREIVGELAKLDAQNDYVVFLIESDFDSVTLPSNFKKVKTNIHWHSFSEQLILPLLYLKENLDLLFVPHFNVPIFYPGKFVTTIHDLTVLRVRTGRVTTLPYPVYMVKYFGAFLAHLIAIKRSQKIFTVSQFVKNDIVKTFRVDPRKVVLTPCAVDESFIRRQDNEVAAVLQKYKTHKPYLFYVGNGYPHKNLERLVKAFELVIKDFPNLSLVLGGKKNFFYERLEKESASLVVCGRLVFPGFIADSDLPALYSGAEAFVNPSLYEGFGIQTLEAFACGCKVICSNATSLPEIGGDLANYFDPCDINNMAKVIKSALVKTSSDFAAKAINRARQFSWRSSAQTILEVVKGL
ncbi:MAG: glycosyltransferase family 1 protein [Patescibacteria group bacterium]